ncbi:MAG: hypothetical protein ACFKPT_16685 [Gloeotrichia echinulata GP01]
MHRWGLGTLRQAQCIAGDWGHFDKLSASLGTGDTSTSSVHRWGLGTLRQAQCIAGDWGHFDKLSASLGTGEDGENNNS